MNFTTKLLVILLLLTALAAICYASDDPASTKTPNADKKADTDEKQLSLKDKIHALERVMFLAKRHFVIDESDYEIMLADMEEYLTKEDELSKLEVVDEKNAQELKDLAAKAELRQREVLKEEFDDFQQYLKDNDYQKTSGWANVEKAGGFKISALGLTYVFSGLIILVALLVVFGKIFAQKNPNEDVITIEMDNSPVRESSKSQVKRTVSTILIRKDLMEKKKHEVGESKGGEVSNEIAIAIAMAIHAELHLYAKSEKITVLDYPNVVSSWAFTSRPVVNSHFQKLRKR